MSSTAAVHAVAPRPCTTASCRQQIVASASITGAVVGDHRAIVAHGRGSLHCPHGVERAGTGGSDVRRGDGRRRLLAVRFGVTDHRPRSTITTADTAGPPRRRRAEDRRAAPAQRRRHRDRLVDRADAIELAVSEINAGRRDQRPADQPVHRGRGRAARPPRLGSLDELIGAGVDAIVGPASSLIAPQVLPITDRRRCADVLAHGQRLSLDAYPRSRACSSAPFRPTRCRRSPSPGDRADRQADGSDRLRRRRVRPAVRRTGQRTSWTGAASSVLTMERVRSGRQRVRRRGRHRARHRGHVVAVIGDSSAGPPWSRHCSTRADEESRSSSTTPCACRRPPAPYARLADEDRALLSGVSPQSRITNEALLDRFSSRTPTRAGCSPRTRTTAST